jgi:hypothetical protein
MAGQPVDLTSLSVDQLNNIKEQLESELKYALSSCIPRLRRSVGHLVRRRYLTGSFQQLKGAYVACTTVLYPMTN